MAETYKYLALDPGTATGWATFDSEGTATNYGTAATHDELMQELDKFTESNRPDVVIIESFKLFNRKAKQQSGSDMPASQAIGIIKVYASRWGAKVVMQDPSIKPIAQKWSGMKPVGAHKNSHWVDAMNHGIYYLVKNKIRKLNLT